MKFKALGLLLAGLTLAVCAAPREDVDLSVWRINGIEVTATADQLNSLGTAGNIAWAQLSNAMFATVSGDAVISGAGVLALRAVSVDDNNIALANTKIIVGNAGGTGAAVNVSGDIDLANTGAMTIKDVSVADNDIALAPSYMLVGNAGGTGTAISVHGDASMDNAGALSVTQMNSVAAATITAGAAAGATALQPGVCAVTATTDAGVATVLVTNSLASQTVMCGWLSTNAGGFATAVNLTSIAVDGNSLLYTAADNPSPIFRTHTDGKTTFTITFSGASTNCFNVVQRDGAIKSSGSILPEP